MAAIERMERGKPCRMGARPYYNHQTWHNGRNVVRYVPKDEAETLKKDIAGYRLFTKLAEQYAGQVIRATRRQREKEKRAAKKNS